MHIGRKSLMVPAMLGVLVFCCAGCATPGSTQASHTRILDPSQEDNVGGSFIESGDIQTIAQRMCTSILAVPEIAGNPGTTRVAIAPIRNSTRYVIDKDIFMKRLRIEMSRHSQGKVRFYSQTVGQEVRSTILKDQQEEALDVTLNIVADYLISSPIITSKKGPIVVAIKPGKNVNFVNLNADSYIALLRAKIAERGAGRIVFAAPGADTGMSDYELLGEFIAKSIKREGIATPFDDEKEELETRDEKDLDVDISVSEGGAVTASVKKSESSGPEGDWKKYKEAPREFKEVPDVTKYLNVMLVDAESNTAVWEKIFTIEKKVTDGLGGAELLLTGELSALSKAGVGERSDYVIMSFQLVEPQSNEILWEDAYETKRVTSAGIIYR